MSPIIKSISKGDVVECVGFGYVCVTNTNYRIKRLKLRLNDGEFGWCSTTLSSGNQTVVMEPLVASPATPHENNTNTKNTNSTNISSWDRVRKHASNSSPGSGDKATQAINPALVEDRNIQMHHNRSAISRIFGENDGPFSDEGQTDNFGVASITFDGDGDVFVDGDGVAVSIDNNNELTSERDRDMQNNFGSRNDGDNKPFSKVHLKK